MGISLPVDKYNDDDLDRTATARSRQLPEDARKQVVDGMVARMVKVMAVPPPAKKPGRTVTPDPSIPYKDTAFAMLSHEPSLVSDAKAKAELVAALTHWAQTDFEIRIENPAQQYGIEQIMRFLGAGSVRGLPALITENSTKSTGSPG